MRTTLEAAVPGPWIQFFAMTAVVPCTLKTQLRKKSEAKKGT